MESSLEDALNDFLAIARLIRSQGRRGELLAQVLTDFPQRFAALRRVYLQNPPRAPEPVEVEKVWPHKGRVVLKFAGIDSIERAERLRGRYVLIPRQERMPLPAHHYYLWELEGCRVIAEQQGAVREIGTVTAVESTGGVDLLHVAARDRKRGEVLIPLAQEICRQIDKAAKTIVIDPPEDLLELNEPASE